MLIEFFFVLTDEKWKVVRNFISPSLSTGKIRSMSIAMTESIEDWMETVKIKHENKEPFYPKR